MVMIGCESSRCSANRTPAAMRQQQNGAVDDPGVGERSCLVQNLPTAQLQHEVFMTLGFREQRFERACLDGEHGLTRRDDDRDDVPHLRHLDADRDRVRPFGREMNRRRTRAKLRDEWRRHGATTGGSVVKKRAICMSNRYVDAVTRVPAPSGAGDTAITISSLPWPRNEQKFGP